MRRARAAEGVFAASLALAASLAGPASTQQAPSADAPQPLVASIGPRHQPWQRVFNPFRADARWPASAGIYEPLLVYNPNTSSYTPWLATTFSWEDGTTRLRFALREDVLWSDGQPLTSADVVATFQVLKRAPALDREGLWQFLSEVTAPAERIVDFRFSRPYTPGLLPIGHQPIVPRHVWEGVLDPSTFPDASPVATGPFTEVRRFDGQLYELGRNVRYWQAGKPLAPALRVPLLTTNEDIVAALSSGTLDWASVFIPDIEGTFVAPDPRHRQYWYPDTGNHVLLYLNTRQKPFDDVRVRKAFSLAIDRARILKEALHGYSAAADVTGLPDSQKRWKNAAVLAGEDWTRHDLAGARALLDAAGVRAGADGVRVAGAAGALRCELLVVKGWRDWESAGGIIAANLEELGVKVTVRALPYEAWNDRLALGRFSLAIGFSPRGPTPYQFYRAQMSAALVRPLGERTASNYQRFASAPADALLRQLEAVTDVPELLRLSAELQRLFAREAPSLPLFNVPSWGVFSTRRYTGFPGARNPYATPMPASTEALPVLVEVRPR